MHEAGDSDRGEGEFRLWSWGGLQVCLISGPKKCIIKDSVIKSDTRMQRPVAWGQSMSGQSPDHGAYLLDPRQ